MRVPQHTFRTITRAWLMLAGTGLLMLVLLTAEAAYRAVSDHVAATSTAGPSGYEAEDHFVGVALLYGGLPSRDAVEVAAPAAGVTGTIALPALPADAEAVASASAAGVIAAAPFSTRNASSIDRGRALQCLTAAIYYEAASESDAGQSAVAQVILNRVRHPAFPATVCGVVYQGSEHAGCQFSFACDGAMARVPSRVAWARAARAGAMALAGYVYAPVGLATHYHTYAVTPAWNRGMVMTDVVGAHFFHRWKGYWGTGAAFRQVYRGGEPMPGPHLPLAPVAPSTIIAAAAMLPVMQRATPDARPEYAQSGRYVNPPVAGDDHLPPASQVLDRWKDSGKPLF